MVNIKEDSNSSFMGIQIGDNIGWLTLAFRAERENQHTIYSPTIQFYYRGFCIRPEIDFLSRHAPISYPGPFSKVQDAEAWLAWAKIVLCHL